MTEKYDLIASIVLYRTPIDEISRCIESLTDTNQNVLITLINNSGKDQSFPPHFPDNVRIIDAGGNIGYGKGHNLTLTDTSVPCRYNLVLNSDLQFTGQDIDKLLRYMDKNLTIGLVSPRITYPDGEIQKLCRLLPSPFTVFGRAFLPFLPIVKKLDREYQFEDWDYADFGNFPYLSGCFMLIRREVIDEVGVFDERYFMFFEDVDFSRRIHANFETMFHPELTIKHDYRSQQKFSKKLLFYKIVSAVRYFSKWGWWHDSERKKVNYIARKQFSKPR